MIWFAGHRELSIKVLFFPFIEAATPRYQSTFFGFRFFHMTTAMKAPGGEDKNGIKFSHFILEIVDLQTPTTELIFQSEYLSVHFRIMVYSPTQRSSITAAIPGRMTEYSRGRKYLCKVWSLSMKGWKTKEQTSQVVHYRDYSLN